MTGPDYLVQTIREGGIPRYLYKYTTVENCLKMLKDGTVYFADYHSFNDPFECKAVIDKNISFEEWKRFFIKRQGMTDIEASKMADLFMRNPDNIVGGLVEKLLDTENKFGYLCLSAEYDNLLLWAHYADQHKGCCIKLDLLNDPTVFWRIWKVEYSNDYPVTNYVKNQEGALGVLFHKSKAWEYEQEYRVVRFEGIGPRHIAPGTVSAIFLGCKVGEGERQSIIQALESQKQGVDLFQAYTDDKSYKLVFKRIA